ncbi:MAG: CxxxxCH/CxxCH domain-containing protein [Kofleriaceae bacterium]
MRHLVLCGALVIAGCVDARPRPGDACPDAGVHPCGILDPASDAFHGRELARRDWDFALCASCHGADFGGTSAAPSCTSCHVDGPTACATCHRSGPTTGAHATHTAALLDCATCHRVPTAWNDEGHILVAGHADPAPAEVVFTGLATATPVPADRTGPPTYDPATGTCAQVYCHGDVLGGAGGTRPQPVWTDDPPGPALCTSCHGQPPPDHAWSTCATCHPSGAAHLDGVVEVGVASADCSGCHGRPGQPAPPRDLTGGEFSTALGVGAHQAHLTAPHRLGAPIACAACHQVPTTVTAPGHVDTPAPAEVNASLGWDRGSATCATAWCHGPARPVWTMTGQVTCGSCHGIPPATPAHASATTLASCATCHPATVDRFGNILVSDGPGGPTSAHGNGVVDAP